MVCMQPHPVATGKGTFRLRQFLSHGVNPNPYAKAKNTPGNSLPFQNGWPRRIFARALKLLSISSLVVVDRRTLLLSFPPLSPKIDIYLLNMPKDKYGTVVASVSAPVLNCACVIRNVDFDPNSYPGNGYRGLTQPSHTVRGSHSNKIRCRVLTCDCRCLLQRIDCGNVSCQGVIYWIIAG